jgi:hypothetical protein
MSGVCRAEDGSLFRPHQAFSAQFRAVSIFQIVSTRATDFWDANAANVANDAHPIVRSKSCDRRPNWNFANSKQYRE